ncbi:T9SS type A sorting domain-containing protein [Fluviicola taffensis]|uniref:T9SS type A sorting domain-containing protein n=1 Tax=Fluviicola taffensis TaxID=191579 RepID=UPI0031380FEE
MKKQITLLSGLLLVSGAFAQNAKLASSPRMAQTISTETHKATPVTPAKALGTALWSSDFSNPSDWTIDNDGQTGGNFGWNINATKEGWANSTTQGIINSTSDGNFAELGNGNPSLTPGTQALGVDYYLTQAAPITISSQNLILSFMQNGALFNDLQEFQISVNGGTSWITVGDNTDKGVLSQSGGSPYANPTQETINLASYIPGGSTSLMVRFHWTTRFPAQATNANVWVTYGWNIDDVAISTPADYDLAITNDYWGSVGLGYFKIPTTQIAPIEYSLNVKNEGGSSMTNVVYGVGITGAGTFVGTSTPGTIAAGASDSLDLTTQFTPATIGTYNVTRTLSATNTDDVPTNNVLTNFSFDVTNYIYARDNNVPNGYTTNLADPFETGNLFDIWTAQTVKGVDVRFATGTPVGSEVYARIYKNDPTATDPVWVGESQQVVTLTAAQINTNLTIYLGIPIALEANTTYFVMVGSYTPDVKVANAGYSPDQTSFLLDGNDIANSTLYYQNETPMVRLNFDPTLGLNELTSATDVTVYPNPFVGTTEIKFNLKADAQVSVVITDVAGRTVATVPATNMNAGEQSVSIDGTNFVAGIYNYTLTVGNETITKRIVKK